MAFNWLAVNQEQEDFISNEKYKKSWGFVADPVIQVSGRLEFVEISWFSSGQREH